MDTGLASPILARIEDLLVEWATGVKADHPRGRGRPRMLPASILWASLLAGMLLGAMSQTSSWRLICNRALWRGRQITVSRSLPVPRDLPNRGSALLPGKLTGLCDVRRQLWRRIDYQANPVQNERVAARSMVADVAPGTLVLADLGYFAFSWFDDLTDAGLFFVARMPHKVSVIPVHTLCRDETTSDQLVWLGVDRADRAKHLVRLIEFQVDDRVYRYLTNVRDPRRLPLAEIPVLYARRWTIETAFKTIKRELGLHLVWSAKAPVILHQVWAVLFITQIAHMLQGEIAHRAGVAREEVSLTLMLAYLPQYAATRDDPLAAFIADGVALHVIRPVRRIVRRAPTVPRYSNHARPPRPDLPMNSLEQMGSTPELRDAVGGMQT